MSKIVLSKIVLSRTVLYCHTVGLSTPFLHPQCSVRAADKKTNKKKMLGDTYIIQYIYLLHRPCVCVSYVFWGQRHLMPQGPAAKECSSLMRRRSCGRVRAEGERVGMCERVDK